MAEQPQFEKPIPKTPEERKAEVEAEVKRLIVEADSNRLFGDLGAKKLPTYNKRFDDTPVEDQVRYVSPDEAAINKATGYTVPTNLEQANQEAASAATEMGVPVAADIGTAEQPVQSGPAPAGEPVLNMPQMPATSGAPSEIDQAINSINKSNAGIERAYDDLNKIRQSDEYKQEQEQRVAAIERAKKGMLELENEIALMRAEKPEGYWENKSGWQKALAGIGLLFGAVGAADGRGNRAVGVIQDAIKQDLEAQKFKRDSKLQGLQAQSSLYNRMLELYKDPQIAMSAATIAKMDEINTSISKYQNRVKNTKELEPFIMAKAQFAKIAAQEKAAMQKALAENVSLEKPYTAAEISNKPAEVQERTMVMPDGTYRIALGKKDKEEYDKVAREITPAIRFAQELRNYLTNGSKLDPKQRGEVKVYLQGLVGKLRLPLTGPGILTETEVKNLKDIIGDPNAFIALPSVEKQKLLTLEKMLGISLQEAATQAGAGKLNFDTWKDRATKAREKNLKLEK